jgi:hypothetical protein
MLHTPRWAAVWTVLRVVAAVAIIVAVIGQAIRTIGGAITAGSHVATVVANFFSFFTILSNCAAAIVPLWAALRLLPASRRNDPGIEPRGLAIALASVTTYMVITGIVYNTMLRNIPLPQGSTVGWSNEILHVIAPLFLLLDLFVGPFRRALPWRDILAVLGFPIVWVIYTLVRGPLITNPSTGAPSWYPYPFLDPNNPNLPFPGYAGVVFWVVVIAVGIVVAATVVIAVGRRRGQSARASGESPSADTSSGGAASASRSPADASSADASSAGTSSASGSAAGATPAP